MAPHVRFRYLLVGHVLVAVGLALLGLRLGPSPQFPWYIAYSAQGFLSGHVAVIGVACAIAARRIPRQVVLVTIGCLYCAAVHTTFHWWHFDHSRSTLATLSMQAYLAWEYFLTPSLVILGTNAFLFAYGKRSAQMIAVDGTEAALKHGRTQFALRDLFVGVLVVAGLLTMMRASIRPIPWYTGFVMPSYGDMAARYSLSAVCQTIASLLILRGCLAFSRPAVWTILAALAALAVGSMGMFARLVSFTHGREFTDPQLSAVIEYVFKSYGGTNLAHVLTLVATFLLLRRCGYRFVPRSDSEASSTNEHA